jgi:hypothetical protein
MYEIISIPWKDNNKGESWWVKSTYWAHDDGTATHDTHSDGDHEPVEWEDVPHWSDAQSQWDSYYLDCIRSGEDPLSEFFVIPTYQQKQRWQVKFIRTIAGVQVCRVRRAGKEYLLWELPKPICDYLLLKDDGTSSNTSVTLEDLESAGLKLYRWETITITINVERSAHRLREMIKKSARNAYNSRVGRHRLSHLKEK